jgi:hypothetical protein
VSLPKNVASDEVLVVFSAGNENQANIIEDELDRQAKTGVRSDFVAASSCTT